jgi:ABC-type antimicrobial peptide transport system permease subunit
MAMDKLPNQVHLSFKQTIRISLNSLKIRMGRSLITLSGVILAIAFLASIWFNQDVINGLKIAAPDNEQIGVLLQKNKVSLRITGLDDKTKFLIILSLLVSAVGIVNAMLMSVTERYKEIGTMKCLGALDSLIIRLFVIESSILGFVGSFLGVLIGLLIAYIPSFIAYGGFVWTVFSPVEFFKSSFYSIAIGVILSVMFAIYPAYVAAKMKPVDAMRVDA